VLANQAASVDRIGPGHNEATEFRVVFADPEDALEVDSYN